MKKGLARKVSMAVVASAIAFGGVGAINELQPSKVEAASAYGMSVNLTKNTWFKSTDANVTVAIKNDNTFTTGANYSAQINENGKWVDLDWNSPNPLDPEQKVYDSVAMSYFPKAGIYRYKVEVDRYNDTTGDWMYTMGTFYTDAFYIKN